jgi:hypothetical protein
VDKNSAAITSKEGRDAGSIERQYGVRLDPILATLKKDSIGVVESPLPMLEALEIWHWGNFPNLRPMMYVERQSA